LPDGEGASEEADDFHFDEMSAEGARLDVDEHLARIGTGCEGLLPPGTTASSLISLLARLRVNMFSFTDEQGAIVGAGCYPRAAILNHSCACRVGVHQNRLPRSAPPSHARLAMSAMPARLAVLPTPFPSHAPCLMPDSVQPSEAR